MFEYMEILVSSNTNSNKRQKESNTKLTNYYDSTTGIEKGKSDMIDQSLV